jgi:hypothetical protein
MDHRAPILGGETGGVLPLMFQVFNKIQKHVHRACLAGRTMLVNDGVDGDLSPYVGQFPTLLFMVQRLNDGKRAMLAVLILPPPPDGREDLARTKMVNTGSGAIVLMKLRKPEAEAVESLPWNVVSDIPNQASGAQVKLLP